MLDSAKQETLNNEIHRLCDLFSQGSVKEVLDQTKKLLKRFPKSAALHIIAGDANTKLKQFDTGVRNYKKAIEINPDFAVSHFNLGNVLHDKGDLDAAIKSYASAIKLKPDYADSYLNIAVALRTKGDLDAAIENSKKALKLKPNLACAYLNIGMAQKAGGDLEVAIESFQQAIKCEPDYVEAYLNMGDALNNKGDLEKAVNSYNQVIKLKPENSRAYDGISFSIRYYTRAINKGLIRKIGKIDTLIESERQKLRSPLKKHKIWFVDIPRTSSTSIKVSMGRAFGWPFGQNNFGVSNTHPKITRSMLLPDHSPSFIAKGHIGDNLWDKLDTFTVVRNPYRWSSSLWHHAMKNNDLGLRVDTFDQFLGSLEEKLEGEFSTREIHASSYRQTDYLLNFQGKVLVKHILRFEDKKMIDKFLTANGIFDYSTGPKYVETKSSDHKLDQYEIKKIDRIFEKDFEILGY